MKIPALFKLKKPPADTRDRGKPIQPLTVTRDTTGVDITIFHTAGFHFEVPTAQLGKDLRTRADMTTAIQTAYRELGPETASTMAQQGQANEFMEMARSRRK